MILDFKDIPQANLANGLQDTFELFARDFLETIGYVIIQHPDRGADGKKDLIVKEIRTGLSGSTSITWLVSCKHYAHSGKSIPDRDEPNILERLLQHKCDGFMGFYSTLPSSSLGGLLEGIKKSVHITTFDREKIESSLLKSQDGLKLASRYFAKSFASYLQENPKPAKIFDNESTIHCEYCNKDLLAEKEGIFVLLRESIDEDGGEYSFGAYLNAYFSCKGECDYVLKSRYLLKNTLVDRWIDISKFTSPVGYITRQMSWLNSFQKEKTEISDEAFEKLKKLFISTFPHISREPTTDEKAYIKGMLEGGFHEFI